MLYLAPTASVIETLRAADLAMLHPCKIPVGLGSGSRRFQREFANEHAAASRIGQRPMSRPNRGF